MDRDQLDQMKRQIEEEYRLDMEALERLQRRFNSQASGGSRLSSHSAPPPSIKAEPQSSSSLDSHSAAQQDDITASLRTMFSSVRK